MHLPTVCVDKVVVVERINESDRDLALVHLLYELESAQPKRKLDLRLHVEQQTFLLLEGDIDAVVVIVEACIGAFDCLLEEPRDRAFAATALLPLSLALSHALVQLLSLVAFHFGNKMELEALLLRQITLFFGQEQRWLPAQVQRHLSCVGCLVVELIQVLDDLFNLANDALSFEINGAEVDGLKRVLPNL